MSQIYNNNWIQLVDKERLKKTFTEELYKFVYYYELFISQITRDDEYRAYMNYTIAFYKLVGLTALVEGEYYNIYQPKNFTTNILNNQKVENFYEVTANLKMKDMLLQNSKILALFFDIVDQGRLLFNLEIDLAFLKETLTIIKNKFF